MFIVLSALLLVGVFAFDLSQRSELQQIHSSEGTDNFLTGAPTIFPLIGSPILSWTYCLRSLVIFLAAASLLAGVKYSSSKRITVGNIILESGFIWKFLIFAMLSFCCILIYYFSPSKFSMLCEEDGVIETSTALLLFMASACFAVVAYWSLITRRSLLNVLWFLAFSAGCFLVCMEEISWGQRILGFEKPQFIPNAQNEFNLHNMATNAAQFLYLNFSFVVFIFLPALMVIATNSPEQRKRFAVVPSMKLFVIGVFTLGLNDDFWNLISTQFGFYFGALFLLFMLNASLREKYYAQGSLFFAIAMATVCVQFGLWFDGVIQWQIREVRELAIACLLFFFSVECLSSLYMSRKRNSQTRVTRSHTEFIEADAGFTLEQEVAGVEPKLPGDQGSLK